MPKPPQRPQAQQWMRGVRVKPMVEHLALGKSPGEVGRHGIRMGQEPLVALRFLRRFRLRRFAQRGEKLTPGEVEVRAVGEINVGERADAKGPRAIFFQQWDQPQFVTGRAECLRHRSLNLGPFGGRTLG